MALVGPHPISQWYKSLMLVGRGDWVVFREAALRDAVSPGSGEGLLSVSRIETVGFNAERRPFWILGLLRKPIFLSKRSGVRASFREAKDGTWSQGRGLGRGVGWGS